MDREEVLAKAKRDFQFLQERVLGTLVFGSWARGEASERSDIDLCIVAPMEKEPASLWIDAISMIQDSRYEVRIFELLPLYMKMAVIEEGVVVCSRDVLELYEYFYPFRRLWGDQKHRQTVSREEMREMLGASMSK
jgi:predicted nucleotidyltransferase